jgi:hypothetical protein
MARSVRDALAIRFSLVQGRAVDDEDAIHAPEYSDPTAAWERAPTSARRLSQDYHRFRSKAADRAEAVRLLVPFHAMHRHDRLRPDGRREGTQIGWGGVATGVIRWMSVLISPQLGSIYLKRDQASAGSCRTAF